MTTSEVIFVVDDDTTTFEKINSLELVCRLVPFSDGITALEQYDIHRPKVVVSNLLMPYLHGLSFASIASQLLRNEVVYIADKKPEEIEARFGVIETYFQKPLDDSFFEKIRSLVSDQPKVDSVKHSTGKLKEPAKPISIPVESKLKQLDHLVELWKEEQDFHYGQFVTRNYPRSYNNLYLFQNRQQEEIEAKIETAIKMLGISTRTEARYYSQFKKNHPSFYQRAFNEFLKMHDNEVYDLSSSLEVFHLQIKIQKIELIKSDASFELKINDKKVDLEPYFEADTNDPFARKNLPVQVFREIKKDILNEVKDHSRIFVQGESEPIATYSPEKTISRGGDLNIRQWKTGLKISFEKPLHVDGKTIKSIKFDFSTDGSYFNHANVGLKSHTLEFSDRDLADCTFPKHVPSFILESTRKIYVKNCGDFGYKIYHKDEEIETPLKEFKNYFKENNIIFYKEFESAAIIFNFAMELACGAESWDFSENESGRVIKASELLGEENRGNREKNFFSRFWKKIG